MKLQPGTEVTPNVRLEHLHAQGAMGSVWVAKHVTLGTKVAVKFISDRLDTDHPEVLQRFVREAASAAQIKSSHVVQTFDQGVMSDGTPYIVMEFLEGEELRVRLEREGRLPPPVAVEVVSQTAKALSSAHKVGIIHRDIKPGNIFLSTHDDELHVKVFDFGIAKRRAVSQDAAPVSVRPPAQGGGEVALGLTNDGVMIGTPEFMSPEAVMSASSVDHHADLWSLAVVAYACLTGELPFRGQDVGELCVNLLESQFTPPSEICDELGPEVDEWFATALAKGVSDRFQSAREMALAFAGVFATPSIPGEIPSTEGLLSPSAQEADASHDRGLRAATFSGSAADLTVPSRPRLGSAVVAGVVAAVVLAVVGVLLVTSSGAPVPARQPEASAPDPAERAPASAAVESNEEVESAVASGSDDVSTAGEGGAGGAAPASSGGGPSIGPAGQRPPGKLPWGRPKPKDPGF